jgi:excisionase family DNA binding protein
MTPFEIQQLADAIAERLASRATGDVFLDALGAAALLACSVATVERLTRSGEIPSVKVGRLRRYRRADLMALENKKGGDE